MKRHRFTNITGTIDVRGTNSGGKYKSKLERQGFIRWMSELDVVEVRLQEPRIIYLDEGGKKHRYTGDLLVNFRDASRRRPLVVECKYASQLDRDPDLRAKLKRVGEAMDPLDRDFLVQTEHDIRTEDFKMRKFVFSHRNNDPHPAQREILACMATHRCLTLEQLITTLREGRVKQYEIIPEVWRLVAIHRLSVNYGEILDLSAKISLPAV